MSDTPPTETPSTVMIEICELAPVMPVLVVDRVEDAAPLAKALVAGGLTALEVTFRTAAAPEAIAEMRRAAPEATVGAGTVLSATDVERARAVGAQFLVSPGLTPALADAASSSGLPFLPGVGGASEAMAASERGFQALKLFPANAVGGASMLLGLAGPLPQLRFCPTGGVSPENAPAYLALSNVVCVGGSWVAPRALTAERRWDEIEARARHAAALTAATT